MELKYKNLTNRRVEILLALTRGTYVLVPLTNQIHFMIKLLFFTLNILKCVRQDIIPKYCLEENFIEISNF